MSNKRFMALALSLGRRGMGRVAPWPSVGCVIVREGRIVGRGVSDRVTLRHAEVVALDQAGEAVRGATAYVTLEPCAHHGTTPPCAEALVRAGVARVVSACEDPNPLVAGKGHAILRAAGVTVETGVLEAEARADHAGFLKVQERGLPFLTLKLALSLDGRIATASGDSQWITGAEARRTVHGMRARHDAVLVGAGTVRADDPQLNVRGLGIAHQPVRVVASGSGELPADARMLTDGEGPVWLVTARETAPEGWQDVRLLTQPAADPEAMMRRLARDGLTRIFCEGGGRLAASLLGAGLVDELVVMTGGVALGADGLPGLGPLGHETLADAPRFDLVETRPLGADTLTIWRPAYRQRGAKPDRSP